MISNITTIEDVKLFAFQLVNEENLNFHPDNDFLDYVNIETNLPVYLPEESKNLNALMNKCFEVCEQYNEDLYELMGQPLFEKLKIGINSENEKK
jgi:hypothetical protein